MYNTKVHVTCNFTSEINRERDREAFAQKKKAIQVKVNELQVLRVLYASVCVLCVYGSRERRASL